MTYTTTRLNRIYAAYVSDDASQELLYRAGAGAVLVSDGRLVEVTVPDSPAMDYARLCAIAADYMRAWDAPIAYAVYDSVGTWEGI